MPVFGQTGGQKEGKQSTEVSSSGPLAPEIHKKSRSAPKNRRGQLKVLFAFFFPNVELSRKSEESGKTLTAGSKKMLLILKEVVDNLLGIY